MSTSTFLLILCIVGGLFIILWLRRKFKVLNLPCVFFVSGAVKSGKTLLSVHLALKEFKAAKRRWYLRKYLTMVFLPKRYVESFAKVDKYLKGQHDILDLGLKDYLPPMLYSNIALAGVKYNPLTIDIVERKVRIPNKSVILIDEVSLFADSQLFKDKDTNAVLMSFYKLYGHYSHGGKLIVDSQSISDNHYSMKRCMSTYLYIYERVKYPFFTIMKVRELIYSDDGSIQNNFNEDIELSMRKVFIWNKSYDKYDCYCYSVFTDYLPLKVMYDVESKSTKDDLKVYNIVSLNDFINDLNKGLVGKYKVNPYRCFTEEDVDNVPVYSWYEYEGVIEYKEKELNDEKN